MGRGKEGKGAPHYAGVLISEAGCFLGQGVFAKTTCPHRMHLTMTTSWQ